MPLRIAQAAPVGQRAVGSFRVPIILERDLLKSLLLFVVPAEAGTQSDRTSPALGPRFRRDDGNEDCP